MQKPFIISNLFFLLSHLLYSQTPTIQWQKCYGGTQREYAQCIKETFDKGFIIAGSAASNDSDVTGFHGGGGDYWIIKTDSSGTLQWQKCLGGAGNEYAYSISQTVDSGYILAGVADSNDGDVSGLHGLTDYWIVKLDIGGNIQWQKCLGGSGDDKAYSGVQTTDGGYIVAGYTATINDGDVTGNHGSRDYWIVKLSSSGNIQWQKAFGGSLQDVANSIRLTTDGGYIVTGWTASANGDVSGNHGLQDFWIVKLDSGGTLQSQKCLGGTGSDLAYSVEQTSDLGYILSGYTNSNDNDVTGFHGQTDFWVVKLDSTFNLQWQKCLGGTENDKAYSLDLTSDGGYIVAGYTTSNDGDVSGNHSIGNFFSDYWIIKLDNIASIQWQKCLGGTDNEIASSIEQTDDGGYIMAGDAVSNDSDVSGNHGLQDYWVVKLFTADWDMVTENTQQINLSCYPNPATNSFTIKNISSKEMTLVEIVNMFGEIVYSERLSGKNEYLIHANLSPGIYFVQVSDERKTFAQKLIIQ